MCIDGNSATLSVRYLNAQLGALWQNAVECSQHSPNAEFRSTEYEKSKYTRGLRHFDLLSRKPAKNLTTEELFFTATFGKPELKFICNHDAVFCLKIEEGHLNLAHSDATKHNTRADKSRNRNIKNLELVFRVPFLRTNVSGRDTKISDRTNHFLVQMIALKLNDAVLMLYEPDTTLTADIKEALTFYMQQYFVFLQNSGNHVLFDLPDFDDNKYRPKSDYSLIHSRDLQYILSRLDSNIKLLGNVDGSFLTKFYEMLWLSATSMREAKWGSSEICLASICSDWVTGSQTNAHFFINFNAPKFKVLCSQEVIMTFNIKELGFFAEAGINEQVSPYKEFKGWEIAFIVKVVRTAEGDAGLLRLDFDTAEFSHYHSSFGKTIDQDTELYINIMRKFFSVEYLDILSRWSLHVVLGIPAGPAVTDVYTSDWSETDELEDVTFRRARGSAFLWSERVEKTTIYGGFDQVIALSEDSINRVLKDRQTPFKKWDWSNLYHLTMHTVSVRLLSSGKAIVYVTADGEIGMKKHVASTKWWIPFRWLRPTEHDEIEMYSFSDVTLAYEVDIRLEAHDHVLKKYKIKRDFHDWCRNGSHSSHVHIWKELASKEYFSLSHLILDYENARYVSVLSDVTDLGTGDEARDRLSTVTAYIPEYLQALVGAGHNILYTLPLSNKKWDIPNSGGMDLFALSAVDFKVLTSREVTIRTCQQEEPSTSPKPILLIYGVTKGKTLPAFHGSWAAGWLTAGAGSVGTIGLSRETFLERHILDVLEVINESTTIVPQFVDIIDGQWVVELLPWASPNNRKKSARVGCRWEENVSTKSNQHLEFEWNYGDEWKHQHTGNDVDEVNKESYLSCKTENRVRVPTVYNPGNVEIEVSGTSTLTIGGVSYDEKWSKKSIVTWDLLIKLQTTGGRLSVSLASTMPAPKAVGAQPSRQTAIDIVNLHKCTLPERIEDPAQQLIPKLKETLEGSWEYSVMGIQTTTLCEPVFTRKGDLICELGLIKDPLRNLLPTEAVWEEYTDEFIKGRILVSGNGQAFVEKEQPKLEGQIDFAARNGATNGTSNGNGQNGSTPSPLKPFALKTASSTGVPASPASVPVPGAGSDAEGSGDSDDDL